MTSWISASRFIAVLSNDLLNVRISIAYPSLKYKKFLIALSTQGPGRSWRGLPDVGSVDDDRHCEDRTDQPGLWEVCLPAGTYIVWWTNQWNKKIIKFKLKTLKIKMLTVRLVLWKSKYSKAEFSLFTSYLENGLLIELYSVNIEKE
jgi:hypothetical protein